MTKWDDLCNDWERVLAMDADFRQRWLRLRDEGDRLQEKAKRLDELIDRFPWVEEDNHRKARLWEEFYEIARKPENMDEIMEFIIDNIPRDEH